MTQKKSIASKLLLAAIALTLISFCFLGSTFARYTSNSSGKASLNVAKWEVSITPTADTTAIFDSLSPNADAYKGGASYVEANKRKKSTDKVLVATITNSGAVDAEVTLTVSDSATLEKKPGSDGDTYSDAQIQGLFSIKLYTNTSNDAAGAQVWDESSPFNLSKESGKLYIFAEVTWTSDDEDVFGDDADERDTWVGENITKVSYTISYKAVQNSELPPKA